MSTAGKHKQACKKFREWFIGEYGYLFCEECSVSNAPVYAPHHIYYASRYPKHPQLHNFKNLIMLCNNCHNAFHGGQKKESFERLERERDLKKLFTLSQ